MAIVQLGNSGISCQVTFARQEIGAIALGLDVGRYCVDGILGHETMQVYLAYLDVSIVRHIIGHHVALGVHRYVGTSFHFYYAFPVAHGQVGVVFGTVSL